MKVSLFERIVHGLTFAMAGFCVSMIAFLVVLAIVMLLWLISSAIYQSYMFNPYTTIAYVTAFFLGWASGCYVVKRLLEDV